MLEKDVVVIGAGPAGSIAAREASLQGVDVLLIDMKSEIGSPKRCAEGVYDRGLKWLDIEPDPRWISSKIYNGAINSPDGNRMYIDGKYLPEHGYVLERKVFDKHLAMDASRAGTQIMIKTKAKDLEHVDDGFIITCDTFKGELKIKAKVVIGADGPQSNIGKMVNLDCIVESKYMMSCAQYEMCNMDIQPETLEFFFGPQYAKGGYIWIFPKGDDIANVGIGIAGDSQQNAQDALNKFISESKYTKNAQPVELNVGGDPVCGWHNEVYGDNIILCGDAAGQVDPIEGGGLILGMLGGKAAGRMAARAVKEGDCSRNNLKNFIEDYDELTDNAIPYSIIKKLPAVRDVVLSLNDDDFNKLVKLANELDLENVGTTDIIKMFLKLSPRTSLKFTKLLKVLRS
ncbi:MAG: NAD(P)/FAD-dependent oxidoreductase [Methanosphaera sp.]|nr:NAD(P)/FAD-dependent oxidoreductase [Methanosphaera sp.]